MSSPEVTPKRFFCPTPDLTPDPTPKDLPCPLPIPFESKRVTTANHYNVVRVALLYALVLILIGLQKFCKND
jgi:hypothetical protein